MAATHRLGGLAAGVAAVQLLHITDSPVLVLAVTGGAVLGSLLPDIDNPRSFISRKIPVFSLLVGLFQGAARVFSCFLPNKQERYVRSVVGHRGITHSLTACLLVAGIMAAAGVLFRTPADSGYALLGLGVLLGILSHILLDMVAGGVPLFSPFLTGRITLARIKTGGVGEWLFRMAAAALLFLTMIRYFI